MSRGSAHHGVLGGTGLGGSAPGGTGHGRGVDGRGRGRQGCCGHGGLRFVQAPVAADVDTQGQDFVSAECPLPQGYFVETNRGAWGPPVQRGVKQEFG